jgi:preprotein translocase subunit Sec63
MANPYEVLGISSNASDSEVKQARRKLLFDLHSDRLPKDLPAGAAELIRKRVIEINNAYEQIQNERQRESNTKNIARQIPRKTPGKAMREPKTVQR